MATQDQKIKLINSLLDILYKTDKLKHSLPPIKIQKFKKANAKKYNFKEKMNSGMKDETLIEKNLKERDLVKRGILISESTRKRKRIDNPVV